MTRNPVVINLFGPPGSGKSTGAAQVFAALKKLGVNAELVTEFAKDKTWEHNATALGCQEYVFGKQSYRLARCRNDVDVIVTDSPLPLSIIYNNNSALGENFNNVVFSVFNTYRNYNYYINRVKPYNPKGRNQTESEADALGQPIKNLLDTSGIEYKIINGDDEGYQSIIDEIQSVYLDGISCDRLTPHTNETTCELTIDHIDNMIDGGGIYDGIKCPKCGARYFTVGPSVCTLVYYPPIIKDGVNINPDRNKCTTQYECIECGHKWSE